MIRHTATVALASILALIPCFLAFAQTFNQNVLVSSTASTVTDQSGTPNGNFLSSGSPSISFCQTIGCNPGDTSRASHLIQVTSALGSGQQEIGLVVNARSATGYSPSSTGVNNGKEAMFLGMLGMPGAGQLWVQASDLVLQSGYNSDFSVISELDLSNGAYDCPPGGTGPDGHVCNIFGQFISGYRGTYPGTVAIQVSPSDTGTTGYSWHWGINFGAGSIKDVTYVDGTSSTDAFSISGTHSDAVFVDRSASAVGMNLAGNYSYAVFTSVNSTSNVAFAAKAGQNICFDGTLACIAYSATAGKYFISSPTSGSAIASIDTAGNVRFAGTVTASTAP